MPRPRQDNPRSSGRLALAALVLAMLCVAPLAAGCGSGKQSASAATRPAQTSTVKRLETHADVLAAVQACRQGVDLGSWLPQASKDELYKSCERGLQRGLTEIRAYGLEVCREVAFTSPGRGESERTRVFDACYAGIKAKTALIES